MFEYGSNAEFILASFVWRPAYPPALIWLVTILFGSASVLAYFRTLGLNRTGNLLLLSMRMVVIVSLALVLMGPSHLPPTAQVAKDSKLYVMCDLSESMLTEDMNAQSRIDFVYENWLGRQQIGKIRNENELHALAFASQLRSMSLSEFSQEPRISEGQITRLAESLSKAMRENRMFSADPATILLFSDGIDSTSASMSSVIAQAQSRKVQIHTVRVGGHTKSKDATVVAIPLQDYLMPNEPGGILVKIFQVGLDQQTTTLRVRQGDSERTFPVELDGRASMDIQVPIQESESGQYEYEISLDQVNGERTTENNSQTVFSVVQPQRIRVLMIEGQPFWDTKFLAESLRKDERIELTQVSQVTPTKQETIITRRQDQSGAPVPISLQDWTRYDLVVLGNQVENVLPSIESVRNLVNYVRDHGGHVVFARGKAVDEATPKGSQFAAELSDIEPVVWGEGFWSDLKLALTPAGRTARWFAPTKMGVDVNSALARLPGFKSAPVIRRAKTAALVLAESVPISGGAQTDAAQPAMVTMSFGSGSVVAVLGEGVWKWSLLSPPNQDLYGFYDAFWSNLIRWMVAGGEFQPGKQVSLRLSKKTSMLGETIDVDVLLKHESPSGQSPTVTMKLPNGETKEIALTPTISRQPRFHAKIETSQVGTHELIVSAPGMIPETTSERFSAYELNIERLQTAAQPKVLQMLAEDTGGRMFEPHEFEEFVTYLTRRAAADEQPPLAEYIWDQWWIMALLVCWLGFEWIGRRQIGLI